MLQNKQIKNKNLKWVNKKPRKQDKTFKISVTMGVYLFEWFYCSFPKTWLLNPKGVIWLLTVCFYAQKKALQDEQHTHTKASIARYFELFDKNIFFALILSKHLYKLSFKFEKIWMRESLVMVDFFHAFTCIKLENWRRRLVQPQESLICDHLP